MRRLEERVVEEAIVAIQLKESILILAIAGVVVPFLLYYWKVNPILGYICMGVVLGPHGLGYLFKSIPLFAMVTLDSENIAAISGIAEFGIVFLLFLIGMELSVKRLSAMRYWVFGIGGLQVIVTTTILAALLSYAGFSLAVSIIIGSSLALSSSAIVIEILARSKKITSTTGRFSVAVLLLQDLAVVPIMFLLGVLADKGDQSVIVGLLIAIAQAILVIICIFVVGRLALMPLVRMVVSTSSPELFMATTLLIIIGASVTTAFVGLSMAFGAFMAGLLLAETEYSRSIETMINPFKGLLLGVFFFSIGLQIDLLSILDKPILIPLLAAALIILKGVVMFCIAGLARISLASAIESTCLIAAGGEFAFIIIGMAGAVGLLPNEISQITLAVVSMTMVMIPLNAKIGNWITGKFKRKSLPVDGRSYVKTNGERVRVIVVGFGRVGETVANMLASHHFSCCIIDSNPITIALARRQGHLVYHGNALDKECWSPAGLLKASVLVVTIDDARVSNLVVESAKAVNSDITVVVRARDDVHAVRLYELGATKVVHGVIEISLRLAELSLLYLGLPVDALRNSVREKREEGQLLLK